MAGGNYIKLDRRILDWEWYKNESTKTVFLHCLLKANWKDGRFEGKEVPRGSFVTSRANLAFELGMSERSVRTSLEHLKSTGELTIKTTSKFSIITVVNYDFYQSTDQQIDQQVTSDRPASDQQVTSDRPASDHNRRKKEYKEGKKESREEGKKYIYGDDLLNSAFADYVQMRKVIKAPMSERAIELAISKLDSLAGNDNDKKIKILNQSVLNSWKGLFELKSENTNNNGCNNKSISEYLSQF